ncbi:MAG: anti-sigma factor family protein [Bacillota bacterium]
MKCNFDHFLLQEYLDGTIDPLEKIILEGHLKECVECRKELTSLKLLMWELEDMDEIEIPEELSLIGEKVIEEMMDRYDCEETYGIKAFVGLQKHIVQNSGLFIGFMPGVKPGAKLLEKGIKKAPGVMTKMAARLYKGSKKLAAVRSR